MLVCFHSFTWMKIWQLSHCSNGDNSFVPRLFALVNSLWSWSSVKNISLYFCTQNLQCMQKTVPAESVFFDFLGRIMIYAIFALNVWIVYHFSNHCFCFSDLLLAAWQWFPCDDCSLWYIPCWSSGAAENSCATSECSPSSCWWQWSCISPAVWERLWKRCCCHSNGCYQFWWASKSCVLPNSYPLWS